MKTEKHTRDSGYRVPEGYFDRFEDTLRERLAGELPEKEGYTVPESYFENLEKSLQSKIRPSGHTVSGHRKYYWLAVAAALIVTWWIIRPTAPHSTDVPAEYVAEWMETNYLEFDAEDIAGHLNDAELTADFPAQNDEIDEYLLEQDLDDLYIQ